MNGPFYIVERYIRQIGTYLKEKLLSEFLDDFFEFKDCHIIQNFKTPQPSSGRTQLQSCVFYVLLVYYFCNRGVGATASVAAFDCLFLLVVFFWKLMISSPHCASVSSSVPDSD